MIKTNIKATTYKNIPTDLNEDMSYLDFKLGEKHFSENELKWFVKFHNMKRDVLTAEQGFEYEMYLKMFSIMALNKEYDLEFEMNTRRRKSSYGFYTYNRRGGGIKISLCPIVLINVARNGRETVHQNALSTLRHEACHWYLHTTGVKGWSDGDKEFEELLMKVDADSTRARSKEESKTVQQAIINGTYKKTTGIYDVKFKKINKYKEYEEGKGKTAKVYLVVDNKTGENLGVIVKADWGSYVPMNEEFLKGVDYEKQLRNLERGYTSRKGALSLMMKSLGK